MTLAIVAGLTIVAAACFPRLGHSEATTPIRHVVVIDLENHSFDNVLGKFCVDVARGAIHRPGAHEPCDGADVGTLPDGARYRLRPEPDYGLVVDHDVDGQAGDIAGGGMNGFTQQWGCGSKTEIRRLVRSRRQAGLMPMGWLHHNLPHPCMTQLEPMHGTCGHGNATCIPNAVTLAKDFAVSDRTFELHDTPSWAGHMVLADASMDRFFGTNPKPVPGSPAGRGWGCDSGKLTPWWNGEFWVKVPSCVPNRFGQMGPLWSSWTGSHAGYLPTIFDRLDSAGLSWRIYGGTGATIGGSAYGWTICPTFWECLGGPQRKDLVSNLNFVPAARDGTLPSFSILAPDGKYSEHQPESIGLGDAWLGRMVSAVENGPDWSSTAIFITWDDCGCFYDHVNPLQYSTQWGIRVPMIIVSPWARAGFTDSNPATFASLLTFTERVFGLQPLHPCATVRGPGRACTDDLVGAGGRPAYNYMDAFDFSQKPLDPVPLRPFVRLAPREARKLGVIELSPQDPT